MEVRSHKDLIVWQKAMDLAEAVYTLTTRFPSTEKYRLVDQLSRSVVSIAANIAEGHSRGTRKDYANFISIAMGSLAETETYLLLATRLRFAADVDLQPAVTLLAEVSKMLTSLRARLNKRPPSS